MGACGAITGPASLFPLNSRTEANHGNHQQKEPRQRRATGQYAHRHDFDRVTAERDALQQRLTAADERADVLEGLLWEYVDRDEVTNEWAREWLYAVTTALKPAEGGGDEA